MDCSGGSDGDGDSECPDTPIGVEVDERIAMEGVYDDSDNCPDTPVGVEVDRFGCPKTSQIDSDGDGVYDDSDACPDTPVGAIVDDRGCWVVKGVQF